MPRDKDGLTSTKKAQGGSWSRSNGFTFSLTCPFLIENIISIQKQNYKGLNVQFYANPKKELKGVYMNRLNNKSSYAYHTCVRKGLLGPQTCHCQAFSLNQEML